MFPKRAHGLISTCDMFAIIFWENMLISSLIMEDLPNTLDYDNICAGDSS
jgi:hypothetical protein